MGAYVDEMITNSVKEISHMKDLEETFKILRHYGMKLNTKKCTFRVRSGIFLRYMIDHRGIKANPNKIKAVLSMKSLITVKEVQKLTGCIAAWGRFTSRSVDKCLPFFKVPKKKV